MLGVTFTQLSGVTFTQLMTGEHGRLVVAVWKGVAGEEGEEDTLAGVEERLQRKEAEEAYLQVRSSVNLSGIQYGNRERMGTDFHSTGI